MPERSAIPGIKRLPKPAGFFTWYWVAAQLSSKTGGFHPRTARLWHGKGEPAPAELEAIKTQANQLSMDLEEWASGRIDKRRSRRAFTPSPCIAQKSRSPCPR